MKGRNGHTGPRPEVTPEQRRLERELWHAQRDRQLALARVFKLDNRVRTPK